MSRVALYAYDTEEILGDQFPVCTAYRETLEIQIKMGRRRWKLAGHPDDLMSTDLPP